jgi:hypothetical protein
MNPITNLTGKVVGRLTVTDQMERRTDSTGRTRIYWHCLCSCGKEVWVLTDSLRRNSTKSCGCLNLQRVSEMGRSTRKHGQASLRTAEYRAWKGMKARCYRPTDTSYRFYGGRIRVCDRWRHSFENFFQDMGTKPSADFSLERIDNDADYSPSNCVWATITQQNRNKSNNRKVIYQGKTMSLAEACEKTETSYDVMYHRIGRGRISFEEALAGGRN